MSYFSGMHMHAHMHTYDMRRNKKKHMIDLAYICMYDEPWCVCEEAYSYIMYAGDTWINELCVCADMHAHMHVCRQWQPWPKQVWEDGNGCFPLSKCKQCSQATESASNWVTHACTYKHACTNRHSCVCMHMLSCLKCCYQNNHRCSMHIYNMFAFSCPRRISPYSIYLQVQSGELQNVLQAWPAEPKGLLCDLSKFEFALSSLDITIYVWWSTRT